MRPSLLTYTAPGAGRRVALGTFSTTFKVLSEASRGSVALVEHTLGPGLLGAPLHRHSREDEISYVLSGRGVMTIDDKSFEVTPGTAVLTRPGSSHGLKQAGPDDLVIMINYEQAPRPQP